MITPLAVSILKRLANSGLSEKISTFDSPVKSNTVSPTMVFSGREAVKFWLANRGEVTCPSSMKILTLALYPFSPGFETPNTSTTVSDSVKLDREAAVIRIPSLSEASSKSPNSLPARMVKTSSALVELSISYASQFATNEPTSAAKLIVVEILAKN